MFKTRGGKFGLFFDFSKNAAYATQKLNANIHQVNKFVTFQNALIMSAEFPLI